MIQLIRLRLMRGFVLFFVVALDLVILLGWKQIQQIGELGYIGVFVLAFLFNATVLMPSPILSILAVMSLILSPVLLGLVAATGSTLGEVIGYTVGVSNQNLVERRVYSRTYRWIKSTGGIVIFIAALTPGPIFDFVGIVAGSLKYPLTRFLVACWLGKVIKMIAFGMFGQSILRFLLT
jgi:membrane protein YqaA with SNARE-associated domain